MEQKGKPSPPFAPGSPGPAGSPSPLRAQTTGPFMDQSLYHLFLYATIALTALTVIGILVFLSDRKRRKAENPDPVTLSPVERIAEIDAQIGAFRQRVAALEEEKKRLLRAGDPPHSPRST